MILLLLLLFMLAFAVLAVGCLGRYRRQGGKFFLFATIILALGAVLFMAAGVYLAFFFKLTG